MAHRFSMDRRAYLKTVGAVGASAAIAGCSGGNDDTIVPGTNPGFAPFEYKEGGELVGFDIELAEAAIDRAGYDIGDWSELQFSSLIPSVNNNDIDLIAAGMTINDDRKEQVAFTDPYWESNQAVLVPAGGDFQPESESDLDGASVAAQKGTTGESEAERLRDDGIIPEDGLKRHNNYVLAVEDLENGNVDAVVVDQPVANNFAAERDVSVAFVIETGEQFGMGMRQDDDRIGEINDAIAELRDDGTYDDLVAEWFE